MNGRGVFGADAPCSKLSNTQLRRWYIVEMVRDPSADLVLALSSIALLLGAFVDHIVKRIVVGNMVEDCAGSDEYCAKLDDVFSAASIPVGYVVAVVMRTRDFKSI